MNHSSNPLDGRKPQNQLDKEVFFDWLEEFAKDFSAPARRIWLEGDLLWFSTKIFLNLRTLPKPYRAETILKAEEQSHKKMGNRSYKVFSDEKGEVANLITELNFPGAFVTYLAYEVDVTKSRRFASNKDMLRQFFTHLSVKGVKIPQIEEIYESMFFSWSMVIEEAGVYAKEPWNQTWREFPGRFSHVQKQLAEFSAAVPTFRGQRNLVYDMFASGDVNTSVEKLSAVFFSEKGREEAALSFKTTSKNTPRNGTSLGFWIAGAGMKNDALRRWILKNTPEWTKAKVDPWSSHLLLWLDPKHFSGYEDAETSEKEDPRVERLSAFCAAAVITNNFPEAHDCQMSTWADLVRDASRCRDVLKLKPHLSHVVEKIKRLRTKISPPEKLCRAILESADEYAREKYKKMQKHPKKDIDTAREKNAYALVEVKNKLKKEACVGELEILERLSEETPNAKAACYEEGEKVSHLDLLYSASLIPATRVLRTSRQIFVVGEEDAVQNMIVYKHPLSELRSESKTHHPLWSPKQDLLAECLRS